MGRRPWLHPPFVPTSGITRHYGLFGHVVLGALLEERGCLRSARSGQAYRLSRWRHGHTRRVSPDTSSTRRTFWRSEFTKNRKPFVRSRQVRTLWITIVILGRRVSVGLQLRSTQRKTPL